MTWTPVWSPGLRAVSYVVSFVVRVDVEVDGFDERGDVLKL